MNNTTPPADRHDYKYDPLPLQWSLAVVCDPDIGRMAVRLATETPDLDHYGDGLNAIASELMDLAGPVARVPQLRHTATYEICLPILTAIYQAKALVTASEQEEQDDDD